MAAVSGAGHDAVYMARLAPAGMIFIPCKDGTSHNEIEDAKPEHITAGCNVLLPAMLERAKAFLARTQPFREPVSIGIKSRTCMKRERCRMCKITDANAPAYPPVNRRSKTLAPRVTLWPELVPANTSPSTPKLYRR